MVACVPYCYGNVIAHGGFDASVWVSFGVWYGMSDVLMLVTGAVLVLCEHWCHGGLATCTRMCMYGIYSYVL